MDLIGRGESVYCGIPLMTAISKRMDPPAGRILQAASPRPKTQIDQLRQQFCLVFAKLPEY
jgi:hypothetical protein